MTGAETAMKQALLMSGLRLPLFCGPCEKSAACSYCHLPQSVSGVQGREEVGWDRNG